MKVAWNVYIIPLYRRTVASKSETCILFFAFYGFGVERFSLGSFQALGSFLKTFRKWVNCSYNVINEMC